MAAKPKPDPSAGKLIFAPAGTNPSYQASQYLQSTLHRSSLSPSPITQFHTWFTAAQSSSVHQPETVCLSTCSLPSGRVSSRYVYLKELDSRGRFVIYSNWGTSRKAEDVAGNAYASLAFWWREVERQVRVEGRVERMSREESQTYFGVRARGSKVGAWASRQTSMLRPRTESSTKAVEGSVDGVTDGSRREDGNEEGESKEDEDDGREELEQQVKEVERRFEGVADEDIPCPDFWGGIRVIPEMIEFWQGRESRLHDRFRYTKVEGGAGGDGDKEGRWKIERLSP